jgi:hypothetical protein
MDKKQKKYTREELWKSAKKFGLIHPEESALKNKLDYEIIQEIKEFQKALREISERIENALPVLSRAIDIISDNYKIEKSTPVVEGPKVSSMSKHKMRRKYRS